LKKRNKGGLATLLEKPLNFWQGKHVRLRGVEPSDAETFFEWNLDSATGSALEFLWPPVSLAQIRSEVEAQSLKKLEDDHFKWMIEDAAGTAVGSISTHECEPRHGTFSYGVNVAREHRGKGYAGEAIMLVVRYYFEELRYQKVTVGVADFNAPSIRLHEKLGFTHEGTLRRMRFTRGSYFDIHLYGLTREEWEKLHPQP
jgi:RimJ/RimL family protein N-acetyltransferase